jgi:arginine-tRNA-protein transferase
MPTMDATSAREIVDRFLEEAALPLSPPIPCPYLPDRVARNQGFLAERLSPEIYVALMHSGFRRSGRYFYRPNCENCQQCIPLRVPVKDFERSKGQRRLWRRNQDLEVRFGPPDFTPAKWNLYSRYLDYQHDTRSDCPDDLFNFLYASPVQSIEFTYLLDGALIGVSIADRSETTLSSVYMYFDPRFADRSLGRYSILWEIDFCRNHDLPYYYLGYYVKDCTKMSYKASIHPHEMLNPDGSWSDGDQ